MSEQPRDTKGRFRQINTDEIELLNDEKTLGVVDDEHVTPALEMVNVNLSLLEEAIEEAKEYDNSVRIGILRKKIQNGSKHEEKGLVCLKGSPHDDETVVFASLAREWDESSYWWQEKYGEGE